MSYQKTVYQYITSASLLIVAALLFISSITASAQTVPANSAPGSTFEQRLAQRKGEHPAPLDEKVAKRYQSVCTKTQSQVRELQSESRAIKEKRNKVYNRINAKLWVATGKLKLAEKDTFKLEAAQTKFNTEVATFNTTLTGYQQTLDDLLVINCQADVPGFNALVQTTRLYYKALSSQATAINKTVVDTIKPTLGSYSSELK